MNGGEKNPLKITNWYVAENILDAIQKYGTEEQSDKAKNILDKWQNIPWQNEKCVVYYIHRE